MPAPTAAMILALAASQFGASAGVRTETRGGLIPTGGAIESDPSLDVTISPTFAVTMGSSNSTFVAGYDLRLLRRFFVDAAQRFIIMHNGRLGYSDKFGRGWVFNADLATRYGEIDFANANLNTPQPGSMMASTPGTAPAAVSIPVFTVGLAASLTGQFGRNHTLGFTVLTSHQRPLNIDVETASSTAAINGLALFEELTNGSLAMTYGYTVGPSLSINASGSVGFTTFPSAVNQGTPGQNFTSGSASGGLSYRIGRSNSISGSLGTLISQGTSGFLISPIGRLGWTRAWASNLQYRVSTNLQVGVSGIANPLAGNVEPRLDSRFLLTAGFGKDWTANISAFMGTPVPINRSGGMNIITPDLGQETALGFDVPIAYRISDTLSVDFGVSAQVAATRFDAMDFRFLSPSITAFVGLNARVGLGL